MSYEPIETALLSVIRRVGSVAADDVSAGDRKVLAGGQPCIVVFRDGNGVRQHLTLGNPRTDMVTWSISIELWEPRGGRPEEEVIGILKERVDTLVSELTAWPELENTPGVMDTLPEASDSPDDSPPAGPEWALWTAHLAVQELQTITTRG